MLERYEDPESIHKILYRIENKLDRLLEDRVGFNGNPPSKEEVEKFIKDCKKVLGKRD